MMDLTTMALDDDWSDIDALLTAEEWPFVRGDFEVSAAQTTHSAHVVRVDRELAGFFVAHGFGDVGYLDMMIVGSRWRGQGVARPLYMAVIDDLAHSSGTVVHTTNDSAPLIRLLGFQPGATYTLLARDPQGSPARGPRGHDPVDTQRAVRLDAETFGVARPRWTKTWLARDEVDAVGHYSEGELQAFVALRPRRGAAWGLDLLSCPDPEHLRPLLDRVVAVHGHRRLECFVRDGSPLQAVLREHGFEVPEFFRHIGPLIEWRQGDTAELGDGDAVHTLLWL